MERALAWLFAILRNGGGKGTAVEPSLGKVVHLGRFLNPPQVLEDDCIFHQFRRAKSRLKAQHYDLPYGS
jgi:hypothetical protein